MTAQIKILIEGYARKTGDEEFASSTTVLIKEKGVNIIVDPGMDRKKLQDALLKERMEPNNINYVILTHYHLDHTLLAGIFENAQIIDFEGIYSWDGKIKNHGGMVPGTDVKIIKTPGHDPFHCVVLTKTNNWGSVVIAADVFWWQDDEEQKTDEESLMTHEDPYMKNKEELTESRKKILGIADYIIPGHGKMFKIKK
ncbi:MAG: MBL fold metallo-hydrolase [Candidatus Pacebacteria bacterium]|nr:MBL fold metallo-hydrolase [Candidatus Paceibacterota bacterium]